VKKARRSSPAVPARQDAAKAREDQGHHRWSAACGRALRSPQAQGRLRDRQDRRRGPSAANVRGKRASSSPIRRPASRRSISFPIGKHIIVTNGDSSEKGDQLTEGPVSPHDPRDPCGPQELQEHLVNEVQEVYRLQGVEINDKHIEIIIRQMLRKVKITDPGDTSSSGAIRSTAPTFERKTRRVEPMEEGGKPAEASPSFSASPRPRSRPNPSSPPRPSRTPPACSPKRPRSPQA
jgi:hypothetical protein